jgi:hypothetical protein
MKKLIKSVRRKYGRLFVDKIWHAKAASASYFS